MTFLQGLGLGLVLASLTMMALERRRFGYRPPVWYVALYFVEAVVGLILFLPN